MATFELCVARKQVSRLEQALVSITGTTKKTSVQVGGCRLSFGYKHEWLWLYGVHVDERARGKGYAALAMQELVTVCDKLGIRIKLEAVPLDDDGDMKRLVRFYKRFGFTPTQSTKQAVVMERKPIKQGSKMSIHEISNKLAAAGVKHVVVAAGEHNKKLSDLLESYAMPIVEAEFKPLHGFLESAWVSNNADHFEIGIAVSGKYNFTVDLVYLKPDVHVSVSGRGSNINDIQGSWTEKSAFDSLKSVFALNGKEFKSFLREVLSKVKARCVQRQATAAFPKKESVQTPEGWDTALEAFKDGIQKLEDKYIADNGYKHLHGTKVSSEDALKYTKVFINEPGGNRRIYCFIDRSNGNILMPATFSTPAKGARGNIFDADHGMKRMGPHGPAYNK